MSLTLYDDPQSMASLQECDVPPIRQVMGHRHKLHWKRKAVAGGIANGMMMARAVMQCLMRKQDGSTW